MQNGGLDARNPFESEASKPDLRRYRTGAALGGPVIRDRTFYYAAFEQEQNRAQEDSFINPGVANAINRFLATGAFPRLSARSVTSDFFPAARAETEASVKVTHQLNQRNTLTLRYAFTNNREAGDAINSGGLTDVSARGSTFTDLGEHPKPATHDHLKTGHL